jgi:HSP20 family protein
MTDIVRRDPFDLGFGPANGLRQVMERIFDEPFLRTAAPANGWDEGTLPVDIAETDGKLLVRASLPGFAKDDIDVQVNEGVLSIKAEHSEDSETKNEKYYRRERRYGSVSRRIALPGIVHDSPVDAELRDGVLTLSIEVPQKAQPKQIEIKTA